MPHCPTEVASRAETGHREAVVGLKSQLMTLQERVRELEREKEALSIQHHSTLQKQSNSLSSVETVSRLTHDMHLMRACRDPGLSSTGAVKAS